MSANIFFPTSMDNHCQESTTDGTVLVVTRTKNRPVLLARALASVLSQTYQNWQLHVVNDGGDPEPVNELLALYDTALQGRCTVIHHPKSLGMEAASNSALNSAHSEYVVIHDDDDAWCPSFLAETVKFLEDTKNSRYAAVATNCTVVYEEILDDKVVEQERQPWGFWKERVDLLDQLLTNNFPPICLLIRKSVVDQIGLYNEELPVLGDWDYNLRILMLGDIGTINKPLAYYHHRRSSKQSGNYGNSVTSGRNTHLDYQVLYRNSLLRNLLQKEPGFSGLLHLLLVRIEKLEQQLLHTIHSTKCSSTSSLNTQLLDEIQAAARAVNKILRPLRAAWKLISQLRRSISRARARLKLN